MVSHERGTPVGSQRISVFDSRRNEVVHGYREEPQGRDLRLLDLRELPPHLLAPPPEVARRAPGACAPRRDTAITRPSHTMYQSYDSSKVGSPPKTVNLFSRFRVISLSQRVCGYATLWGHAHHAGTLRPRAGQLSYRDTHNSQTSTKFTTHNDLSSKRVVILIKTKLINHKCLQMSLRERDA